MSSPSTADVDAPRPSEAAADLLCPRCGTPGTGTGGCPACVTDGVYVNLMPPLADLREHDLARYRGGPWS